MNGQTLIVRQLGLQDYASCWQAMQTFTNARASDSLDELWLLEHHPVYTLGQNGKPEHLLKKSTIPMVKTDRGGQITYHGPGQLMGYTLIDLKRKKLNIRAYVTALEQTIVSLLANQSILANTRCEAPGVYVNEKKICSIGLRIRKGCTYHGIALNVSADLLPFSQINPCGFQGLEMTSLALEGGTTDLQITSEQFVNYFSQKLGYTQQQWL